ncbi:MAG TPA: TPM domain-containing protein [Chryseolinea sp.]|nr:TPM domain-containing protein [Chryseolinea sp.]
MRFSVLLVLLPFICLGQLAIPEHGGKWVHDEANIISAQSEAMLESMLKSERDSTSNQIAVLTMRSLQGEPIEDYSLRVAEAWKLGKAEKDNGVLLLIAIDDRELRIEAGYGLEGVLTDALSSRINRNEIAPHFRQGDYDGGVQAGVTAIIQAIKGEYKNDDPPQRRKSSRRSPLTTLVILIIIIIIASRKGRGGRGGGGYWSSGSGWVGPMGGFGGGSSGSSWGSGSDFGGGGGFGGGGSSDSW